MGESAFDAASVQAVCKPSNVHLHTKRAAASPARGNRPNARLETCRACHAGAEPESSGVRDFCATKTPQPSRGDVFAAVAMPCPRVGPDDRGARRGVLPKQGSIRLESVSAGAATPFSLSTNPGPEWRAAGPGCSSPHGFVTEVAPKRCHRGRSRRCRRSDSVTNAAYDRCRDTEAESGVRSTASW